MSRSRSVAASPLCVLLLVTLASTIFHLCLCTAVESTPAPPTQGATPNRTMLSFDKSLSGDLVATRNITVTYYILNVGTRPARDVELSDNSFPVSRFDFIEHAGIKNQKALPSSAVWLNLAPGQSITHSFVVQPLKAGELHTKLPTLKYVDADGTHRTSSIATEGTTLNVEDLLEYKRRTDVHTTTWMVYAAAIVALVGSPYVVSVVLHKALDAICNPAVAQDVVKKGQ